MNSVDNCEMKTNMMTDSYTFSHTHTERKKTFKMQTHIGTKLHMKSDVIQLNHNQGAL